MSRHHLEEVFTENQKMNSKVRIPADSPDKTLGPKDRYKPGYHLFSFIRLRFKMAIVSEGKSSKQ